MAGNIRKSAFLASATLMLAAVLPSEAMATTSIALAMQAGDPDFILPAPALAGRYYSGTGVIDFTSTLTDGVYGLADISSFVLNLQFAIRVGSNPFMTADYLFTKSDLSAFSITFVGGSATAASWTLNAVQSWQHSSPNFNPAAQSVDFLSGEDDSVAYYAWPQGVKTLNASGDLDATIREGTPAVPEPASWALMLGGLGLAGAFLRRRPMRLVRAA